MENNQKMGVGLTTDEEKMFSEIFQIFEKYNLKRTFGLFEIHSHFPIKEDQVLYETNNPIEKTYKTVLKNRNNIGNARPTQWVAKDGNVLTFQYCCDTK